MQAIRTQNAENWHARANDYGNSHLKRPRIQSEL